MPRFDRFVLVCCALGLPAAAVFAQSVRAGFDDRVEVAEVLLDVVAFDRRGEAVPGLGIEDFVVREDGQPVELTGVSFYTTWYDPAGGLPADGEHRAEIPDSRYFVLFFHDPRDQEAQPISAVPGMLMQQQRAGIDCRRWLLEDLQPSDWVAVVGFRDGLMLYRDFTQDRDALAAAVRQAAAGRPPVLLAPSKRPRPPASGEPALRRVLDDIERLATATPTVEDALRLVAEASEHIVGRKNLLLFTPGLGPERRRGGERAAPPPLLAALNARSVALYAIDLGGPNPRGREDLVALATGGAFLPGLRFRSTLQGIARENRGYYVLSYRAPRPVAGDARPEIEVEARDRRIQVRASTGVGS